MNDRLLKESDVIKIACQLPYVVNSAFFDAVKALPSAEQKTKCIAQIRIDRDDLEDLVNKKVNEIVNMMSETKTGEWIPVSERLPDEDGEYMVTQKNGSVGRYVFNRNGNSAEYFKRCALAWMPLPEPYREGSEE